MTPRRLLLFVGTAAQWRQRRRDARHQEAAAASVARLALRAEAGLTTWTHGALSVKVDVARAMRAVAEEVEDA
jgi:ethanolamine ammonia-lyase small subunit